VLTWISLGDVARNKYYEFESTTQNRRAKIPAQKKAAVLLEQMQAFDVNDVPGSLTRLARASHQVRVQQHQAGFHDRDDRGGDERDGSPPTRRRREG